MRPIARLAAALLLAVGIALPAHAFAPSETADAALADLNKAARAAYALGKAENLARTGPVILVENDLIFIRDGERTVVPYLPPLYTTLKNVSHIALGTIVLLQAYAGRPETAERWRGSLTDLRDKVRTARPLFAQSGLEGAALSRNEAHADAMLAFIDGVLERGVVSAAEVETVARAAAPVLLANGSDAARIQLDAMHEKVQAWRAGLKPGEWETTRVMVLGPRMPREGNLQFEYFVYAMGRDAIDRRLIYAETIFDPQGQYGLLGTVVTDRRLAAAMFGDEMRMDRDFMADGAQAHLLRMFGKLGTE